METLKSLVPCSLKRMISETDINDLPSTCSSFLEFILSLQQFHDAVRDLTNPETALCRKKSEVALDLKQKGNDCFCSGDYAKALDFYSQALCFAPMDAGDVDRNLVVTLYVNRASSFHKIGLLAECIRDCNRAILLSPSHAKAWYWRGKANAALVNYEDAICDLNVAINMELTLGGKRQIKSELGFISNQQKGTRKTMNSCSKQIEKNSGSFENQQQVNLQCVSTPTKGRGMAAPSDIPQASLVHFEEPYAAIVLKNCQKTHCHFCFNELPADVVPCSSCSMPLYCSLNCQIQAGGQQPRKSPIKYNANGNLSEDLENYILDVISSSISGYAVTDGDIEHISEHGHECGGAHWPAILPSEIVLAGRVLAKFIEKSRSSRGILKAKNELELCHNYSQLSLESKLELHIYSVVLTYCLQHSYSAEFPLIGSSTSQLVVLISQIKVNSMAIVHMKSMEEDGLLEQSGAISYAEGSLTCSVKQVRVGQAIYSVGSLFNHSCQPNVHSYFLSRTLFIRSLEFVAAGNPLELSYGPQVGQWDFEDRQKLLEEQYSFKCQCSGCSELNLSDLVLNAFGCVRPNCFGTVLDRRMAKHEKNGSILQSVPQIGSFDRHLPVDKRKKADIDKVAHLLLEQTDGTLQIDPGYCLNCCSYRDLVSSLSETRKAGVNIRRLQEAIVSKEISTIALTDALRSLHLLRSTMHAFNKEVARAEDNLAEAFCLVGKFRPALDHCKASIEILEKLYHANHIVIGNELVKLASILLSSGDFISAADSINRLDAIFSLHYGSHAARIFPYLERLKRESGKIAHQRSSYLFQSKHGVEKATPALSKVSFSLIMVVGSSQ